MSPGPALALSLIFAGTPAEGQLGRHYGRGDVMVHTNQLRQQHGFDIHLTMPLMPSGSAAKPSFLYRPTTPGLQQGHEMHERLASRNRCAHQPQPLPGSHSNAPPACRQSGRQWQPETGCLPLLAGAVPKERLKFLAQLPDHFAYCNSSEASLPKSSL